MSVIRPVVGQTVYGNAASFDGATQYLTGTNNHVTTETSDVTFAMWVNITAYGAGTTVFFSNGASNANGTIMQISSAGLFGIGHNFRVSLNSATTLSLATWYHVAMTITSGTTQCWVNGVTSGGTTATTPNSAGSDTTIGGSTNSSHVTSGFFNGLVDEVRVYNRAISSDEMIALYNNGLNINNNDINSGNLVAWWKLDESSGSAFDSSGSNNTLGNNGTTPFVTGKVEISNTPARTLAGTRTVAGTRLVAAI